MLWPVAYALGTRRKCVGVWNWNRGRDRGMSRSIVVRCEDYSFELTYSMQSESAIACAKCGDEVAANCRRRRCGESRQQWPKP